MRSRLAVLVAGLVLVPAATAVAQAPYLVTGGGQVVASSGQTGPGDTIAFTAGLDRNDAPFGSLQVVKTSEAQEGQRPSVIYNARVTCVEPGGDSTARFGGTGRAPNGESRNFTVDVMDTGDEDRGTDTIKFQFTDDPCSDFEETLLNGTTLARGNLKVDTASSGR
jgi:hypothetical protein